MNLLLFSLSDLRSGAKIKGMAFLGGPRGRPEGTQEAQEIPGATQDIQKRCQFDVVPFIRSSFWGQNEGSGLPGDPEDRPEGTQETQELPGGQFEGQLSGTASNGSTIFSGQKQVLEQKCRTVGVFV